VSAHAFERDILTPADNRVGMDQRLQFITQRKRAVHQIREPSLLRTNRKKFTRFVKLSGDPQARDLALDQRQFQATNTRRLSCTVNVRHRSLLKFIDTHSTTIDGAT
jgi:hypothetical protein